MAFNLVDMIKDQVGGQITNQIGSLLGDQSDMAQAGLDSAVPALLSGLTERASVPGGADALFNSLNDHDDGLLDNLSSALGGNNSGSLIETGTGLLSGLLGGNGLGSLAGMLSGFTGLTRGNTNSLLGMLAPIVMGILKRKVFGDGLNTAGMLDMLNNQRGNIQSAMPTGLSDQLNASGFLSSIAHIGSDTLEQGKDAVAGAVGAATGAAGDAASAIGDGVGRVADGAADTARAAADGLGNAANAASNAAGSAASAVGDTAVAAANEGSSMFRKLLPLIGILLLGWLAFKFFGNKDADVVDTATNAASSAAESATNAATDAASSAAETVSSAATAATEQVSEAASAATDAVANAVDINVDDLGGQLTGLFDNAKSSLEGITDLQSAQDALPTLEGLGEKVGGLGDLVGKVPEAARGPLTSIIENGVGALEPLLEKIRAIPGVGAIIDPIITPILETLSGLAG